MAAAMPAIRSSARPEQNKLLGIGLRIAAATCFGIMAACIKLGYEHGVSTTELVFYRFTFGLPPLMAWIAWSGNYGAWRTRRPAAHLRRALAGLGAMVLAFSALDYLPLAESATIGFVAPLFAVMLSALLLKEPVGRHRWSAVAIGFVGVLIVMRPSIDVPAVGFLLALAAALGVAIVTILIRDIGRTEGTQTIVLWFSLISIPLVGLLMPFKASNHDALTWAILIGLGLFGGIAQLFLTASLRFAPVAVIVPFDYIQLLWAVLLGWALWETQPPATTWIGAAIIVASGLYTILREQRLGRASKRAAPPL